MKIHENSHSNTLLRILPTVMHKITHGFFSPKKFNDGTDFVSPGGFLRKIAKSLGKHDRIPGCLSCFVLSRYPGYQVLPRLEKLRVATPVTPATPQDHLAGNDSE